MRFPLAVCLLTAAAVSAAATDNSAQITISTDEENAAKNSLTAKLSSFQTRSNSFSPMAQSEGDSQDEVIDKLVKVVTREGLIEWMNSDLWSSSVTFTGRTHVIPVDYFCVSECTKITSDWSVHDDRLQLAVLSDHGGFLFNPLRTCRVLTKFYNRYSLETRLWS
jgi:hypothetical protein